MLTHQFPFERYPTAEGWTSIIGTNDSITSVAAPLAGIGSKSNRVSGKNATSTRMYYSLPATSPGAWLWISFYFCVREFNGTSLNPIVHIKQDGSTASPFVFERVNTTQWRVRWGLTAFGTPNIDVPHFVVVGIKRSTAEGSTDGQYYFYFDNSLKYSSSSINNYAAFAGNPLLNFGCDTYSKTGIIDYDDIRFGTRIEDVLPGAVTPPATTGELPQVARTIVLFNQNSADSKTFAKSIAADESLFCPLPCSMTETLADYATFVNEVEHPLKNFLAFQSAVGIQATCIIAGYAVPGFFIEGGQTFSTNGRLAAVDNNFEANAESPLYGTSERLTATVLQAAGVRLAARIDANTQAECNTLKGLGDAATNVTTGETYFTTQAAVLDEQLLRLEFESIDDGIQVSGDAIVYYAQATEGWSIDESANSSRLVFIDSVTGKHTRADVSRNLSYRFRAIISAEEDFSIAAFCRMLLNGGTVVEAFAVAVKKLNSSSQLVGWPFMTASFPKAGYNIYLGDGSQANIDYSQIHAALPISAEEFEVKLSHKPNTVCAMCVRKISAAGIEETRGRTMMLEADSGGLIHQQLPVPYDLTARSMGGNAVELSFSCIVREGQSVPLHFEILGDNGSGEINRGAPVAVVQFVRGECEYAAIVEVTNRPAIFTVRARLDNLTGNEASQVTVMPLRVPVKPKVQI